MRRLFLYRFGFDCPGRFLFDRRIDQQRNAGDDEGDGEKLALIQADGVEHLVFEIDLGLFDELDEETHSEAADKEEPEEESAMDLVEIVVVDVEHCQTEDEI